MKPSVIYWIVLVVSVCSSSCNAVFESPNSARKIGTSVSPSSKTIPSNTSVETVQPSRPITPTTEIPFLGIAPRDCAQDQIDETAIPHFPRVIGHTPVWNASLLADTHLITLAIGDPPGDLSVATYTEHGWQYKLLWLVDAAYRQPITLTGGNVEDGTPLWFDFQNQDVSPEPTLNPLDPPVSPQYPELIEFPSFVLIPKAGCYFIKASWFNGSWQVNFAAGR